MLIKKNQCVLWVLQFIQLRLDQFFMYCTGIDLKEKYNFAFISFYLCGIYAFFYTPGPALYL